MTENNGIVEALARNRVVEGIAERVTKRPASSLCDLVSIVYESLLEMDPAKLRSLAAGGLNFYIVGMIRRQMYGNRTTFYRECVEFAARTVAGSPEQIVDSDGED